MKFLDVFKVLCLSLLILFSIELTSYLYLKKYQKQRQLVYQEAPKSSYENRLKLYNVLDPLLGWSINYNTLNNENFLVQHHSIFFQHQTSSCKKPYKIYISGGSTSDLTFDENNWPSFLVELMQQNDICFEIYLAAVGGYNSGQELLKLIRDVDEIHPDLHISYSGANEVEDAVLVSNYENTLYENILNPPILGWLPNIRTLIQSNQTSLQLADKKENVPSDFWQQNLEKMNAIARYYEYDFIGVLQPVLLHSNKISKEKEVKYDLLLENFSVFYHEVQIITNQSEHLFDFTQIFQNIHENPFIDDCHLKDASYQNMVADSIFTLIEPLLVNTQDSISMQD